MLNKRELTALRKALPDNGYSIIGERSSYSKETVRKVLNIPSRYNAAIINMAIEVIEEHMADVLAQKEKIKTLIS